ncbi:hypothetical protein E2C01_048520 [Portunus trituberculatus]|uniref:Uncharacterized protein n=1 Tax=Portunus trituberculatus TaxID=210409 RepID=A0A5B7GAS7_PORTR|nr:hypothetical protein [Portunus trituberculatus]
MGAALGLMGSGVGSVDVYPPTLTGSLPISSPDIKIIQYHILCSTCLV